MTDYYDQDEFDLDDKDAGKEGFEPFRENIIFLIDAAEPMFQAATSADKEFEGKTWIEVAVRVAYEVLKTRIISSDNDQIAVIFYGTEKSENKNGFDRVYTLHDLEVPNASRIQQLNKLTVDEMKNTFGSTAERRPDDLRYALWAGSHLLTSSSQKASKRVWIFTNDDSPAGTSDRADSYRQQILARSADLHDNKVLLEMFPLIPQDVDFDMTFWRQVLHITSEEDLTEYDGVEVAYRLKSLAATVRHKAFKKRVLSRLRWSIDDDFEIAVQLYALTQPAVKGSAVWLHARTNEHVKAQTAYICADTGAILPEVRKRSFPGNSLKNARFPTVVVDMDDMQELRAVQPPGLRLLGFKPRSRLRNHHQVRNSTFVYPDERGRPGSSSFFIALHDVLLRLGYYALCSYVRNKGAEPVMVAMIPQVEVKDETGSQIDPPGMHMIYLPWADDIRWPESDPAFVGTSYTPATSQQVDAAVELINAFALKEFDSALVPNPHLQRHYQVLESLALDEEPPDDVRDDTLPDVEGMAALKDVMTAFKLAVYGAGGDEPAAKAKPAAAKKRKAQDAAAVAPEVSAVDWKQLATSGGLLKLTVADLKKYCEAYGLPKSGSKSQLAQRITEHMGL